MELQAGVRRSDLPVLVHLATVFRRRMAGGDPLFLFIDGDGTPWTDGGRQVAADPTPRRPLALELALSTRYGSVLYLGRPCYLGLAASTECHPSDWTVGRYSREVVDSLGVAINRIVLAHGFREVILVGHSGGGRLAVLVAPHISGLRAVITIAANLDVRAWTAYHGYLPLSDSLDPTDSPPLASSVVEIVLVGSVDRNVPPALLKAYLAGHPTAQLWTFPGFDHRCRWQEAWPMLLPRLVARVEVGGDASPMSPPEVRRAHPGEPGVAPQRRQEAPQPSTRTSSAQARLCYNPKSGGGAMLRRT
jgi:hypothetical protein